MKCKYSQLLIMKYMDSELSIDEARSLNEHISNCNMCKSDFVIYDSILNNLSDKPAIACDIPSNFVDQVMKKIYDLDVKFYLVKEPENILNAILGFCAVLFGSGILLYIYKDNVLNWVIENRYVGGYIKNLIPSVTVISEYFNNIYSFFNSLSTAVYELMFISRYIVLGILLALIVIQFVIYNKSNNKVES